ncbi:MAG: hypothetical protein HY593_06250 [Candidatus Omnitrophica bacterium]|nr:hypothetical protein [Candidatus Omnitrophota bacterium]
MKELLRFLLKKRILVLLFVCALVGPASAWANVKQLKLYKETFPDAEKPKCSHCHAVEKPTKEKHDMNEYGSKLKQAKETPDAETYKAVGPS